MTNKWHKIKIQDVCKVASGATPRTGQPSYWNGDVSWITPMDLSKINSKYIESGARSITKEGLESCSAEVLPPKSLIMSSRAPIGYFAINTKQATTNQGCKTFVCSNSVDVEFLYYYLTQHLDEIKRLGSGSTFAEVGKNHLENLVIELPSMSIQKRIGFFFNEIDGFIAKTDQVLQKTDVLKQGLMQQLLTKGETKKIKEIATVKRGASPRPIADPSYFAETGRGWIRISDVTSTYKYLNKTSQYLSKSGEDASVKVDPGDLIMSICATVGKPVFVSIPACIHDGFVLFRNIDKTVIDPEFFFYALLHNEGQLRSKGQTGSQMNLNSTIVENTEIQIPQLAKQKEIANILKSIDQKLDFYSHELERLQTLKKGLMQDIFSQKVQIN